MSNVNVVNQRILISPLNWGMGHVSRCIGVIDELLKFENEVIIACDDDQKLIFQEYFPEIQFIIHKGYPFSFGGKGRFAWDLGKRFSQLRRRLINEILEVDGYVSKYEIDLVISDHRYGFYSEKCRSIFLTHQLNLPIKWYQFPIKLIHDQYLKKFQSIWVLDDENCSLSGFLGRAGNRDNILFIGHFSRFKRYVSVKKKTGGLVVVASGPDVYAQQLVDYAVEKYGVEITILCKETINCPIESRKITGGWLRQDEVLLHAETIISRSGYSTLMDLKMLDSVAILVATPGQREQLYLQKRHAT